MRRSVLIVGLLAAGAAAAGYLSGCDWIAARSARERIRNAEELSRTGNDAGATREFNEAEIRAERIMQPGLRAAVLDELDAAQATYGPRTATPTRRPIR